MMFEKIERKNIVRAVTMLILVSAPSVMADPLTLNELVNITMQNNPGIKVAEEGVVQKELALDNEMIAQRPATITLSGSSSETVNDLFGGTGSQNSVGTGTTGLTFSKTLYQYKGGALTAKEQKARETLEKEKLTLLRKKQSLRKQVQHAYLDLLKAYADQQEDEMSLERLREQSRISTIFYEQGSAWKNEVLQSEVTIAQAEKGLFASQNSIRTTEATLNQLMDRNIDAELKVSGELTKLSIDVDWSMLEKQMALKEHPDIISAILAKQITARDVIIKKAAGAPDLSLKGSYDRDYNFAKGVAAKDNLALNLSITWQLWDSGKTDKDLAISRSKDAKTRVQIREKEQAIFLAVRSGWYSLQEAENQIEVLGRALESAKENYRVNQVRYQEQLGSSNDLLSAQDLLSTSKKSWLAAIAQYNKALYTLQYELGMDELIF
ncbi:MAG: TolC family protein [Thiotrichales bacterium]|jgi:outer membrane protein TolC|nr:TolC family protein [Thiotrichales bacterium]